MDAAAALLVCIVKPRRLAPCRNVEFSAKQRTLRLRLATAGAQGGRVRQRVGSRDCPLEEFPLLKRGSDSSLGSFIASWAFFCPHAGNIRGKTCCLAIEEPGQKQVWWMDVSGLSCLLCFCAALRAQHHDIEIGSDRTDCSGQIPGEC